MTIKDEWKGREDNSLRKEIERSQGAKSIQPCNPWANLCLKMQFVSCKESAGCQWTFVWACCLQHALMPATFSSPGKTTKSHTSCCSFSGVPLGDGVMSFKILSLCLSRHQLFYTSVDGNSALLCRLFSLRSFMCWSRSSHCDIWRIFLNLHLANCVFEETSLFE